MGPGDGVGDLIQHLLGERINKAGWAAGLAVRGVRPFASGVGDTLSEDTTKITDFGIQGSDEKRSFALLTPALNMYVTPNASS